MTEPALTALQELLIDDDRLVGAAATGRLRGTDPKWRRAELRYVDLAGGRHLQVTLYDGSQAHIANHPKADAPDVVAELIAQPFANWHVDTLDAAHQFRITGKGVVRLHVGPPTDVAASRDHDRRKPRLVAEDDPVLVAVGISDASGRVKPSRGDKYRQVERFLHSLAPVIDRAMRSGSLRTPSADEPLRVADLGCGNAYLTFAAHRHLAGTLGLDVTFTGVDREAASAERNTQIASELGIAGSMRFMTDTISTVTLEPPPEVVLALHACDTATDDALARAVEWDASVILAAPCCHHDVAAQLRRAPAPAPYALVTRHGILRERLADTITDAVRAAVLRGLGYRVDVIEFVESKHTPRNTLLRAVRTGPAVPPAAHGEVDDLVASWGITPRLMELLSGRL